MSPPMSTTSTESNLPTKTEYPIVPTMTPAKT